MGQCSHGHRGLQVNACQSKLLPSAGAWLHPLAPAGLRQMAGFPVSLRQISPVQPLASLMWPEHHPQ